MSESFKKQIVERLFRNLPDLMVLRMVRTEPMWGYKIIKCTEEQYQVTLRHSALYPLLRKLERMGFLRSNRETKHGRTRKIYEITSKGIHLVDAYTEFLRDEMSEHMYSKTR